MLLFLLSFYLQYDLLICEENFKAKFNEASIANYHRQIRAQLNTLLLEMEEKIRKQNNVKRQERFYKNSSVLRSLISVKDRGHQNLRKSTAPSPVFLPSLQYDPVPPSAIPSITRESQKPGHQLIPMNSIYHGLENDYLANHSSLRSNFGPDDQNLHEAPPFLDRLRILPFSTLRLLYTTDEIPLQAQTPRALSLYVSEYAPIKDSTIITKTIRKTTTKGANAKVWFEMIGPYTRRPKKKKNKTYTETTKRQRTTPRKMTATTKYWSITETANTAQLIFKDEDQIDEEGPGMMPEDPNENEKTTIAGDVLYGTLTGTDHSSSEIKVQEPTTTQAPEQHHLELMEQVEEGYMMVFFLEMFRLIAVKNKHEVQQVLSPMGPIYKTLLDHGGLTWVGDPLQIFIEKFSDVASGGVSVDVLRTYSSMMFHTLVKRKEVLSPEVNSIIDQAEMLYSDEDGKRLLRTLSQFEDYPNNSQDSYLICESLIYNIMEPIRRPAIARSRQRLLDSINRALRRRFPLLTRKRDMPEVGTNLEERNFFTVRPKFGTNPSKRKRRRHHKKKRKRHSVLKPEFFTKNKYMRH